MASCAETAVAASDGAWRGRRPKTGRSHQIRKHLSWAGHPVANDWLYGGRLGAAAASLPTGRASEPQRDPAAFAAASPLTPRRPHYTAPPTGSGAAAEKSGSNDQDLAAPAAGIHDGAEAADHHSGRGWASSNERDDAMEPTAAGGTVMPTRMYSFDKSEESERTVAAVQVDVAHYDELCRHCPSLIPRGWPTDLKPLWLHARTYSSCDFEMTSPLPNWATDSWIYPER